MIFESHAHYDDEKYDEDRETLLDSFAENGIETVINVGASLTSCKRTLALIGRYDFLYGALGVHPSETEELNEENFAWLKKAVISHEKVIAVGETGLDYHWEEPAQGLQAQWFERQLQLAGEVGLPVIVHSRDADKDTRDILRANRDGFTGGVIHCYAYSKESAREYLEMGYYLGVGGVVTFKNGKRLKETVEYAPLDRLLLETDSPYLAPEPYRGGRNSSLNLPLIAQEIANIKGVDVEEVLRKTRENARCLFFEKDGPAERRKD